MKLGIFGGSFDPVHEGHLALARAALRQLSLDELLFVPTGQAWQKRRALSPMADREAMLALALADEPRFVLSRVELEREGPSYMVDTVAELRRERPEAQWFLVIGQDQQAGFHTWHRWQDLLALVTLAVAQRPGAPAELAPEVERSRHVRLAMPPMAVSSTEIRARVAAGQPISGLVPAAVARYIDRRPLYRDNLHDKETPTGH